MLAHHPSTKPKNFKPTRFIYKYRPRQVIDQATLKREIATEVVREGELLGETMPVPAEDLDFTEKQNTPDPDIFKFATIGDVINRVRPVEWTIEGVMEFATLCLLFGDPGSYKSFLALDWALCVATGTKWNDRQVKTGPVFVFIGEGHNGYGRRIKAWMKAVGRYASDAPVFISETPLQVLDAQSAESAATAIRALQEEHGKPALVLFDTLARVFGPGDENSTSDMTRFISVLDSFLDKDITRLLVHHTGHGDKQRSRGSSALKAALDAEFHLERNGDDVALHCRKMKDAPEFQSISFTPEIIPIGGNGKDPITSVYLKCNGRVGSKEPNLSLHMREALSLLDQMGGKNCLIPLNEWRKLCMDKGVYARSAFYTAAKSMEDKGLITVTGTYVELS